MSAEELMFLNCGVEDSCGSLGLQGNQISQCNLHNVIYNTERQIERQKLNEHLNRYRKKKFNYI